MDKVVKKILRGVIESFDLETENLKLVKGKQLKRFKEIYNLDETEIVVYHNNATVVFTDKDLFEKLSYTIDPSEIIAKVEVQEYGHYLYVIRFIKNYMMVEALDLHQMLSELVVVKGKD